MSREYFAKVAPEWDALREGFFSESLRDNAIALGRPRPGCVSADIGAGTGFMSEGLVAAKLKVIAVDESEEMLAAARAKLASSGLVSFRVGSADRIPIETEGVDNVFANMLLHHIEAPALAIREMGRILKPGGSIVITDLDKHNFEFLKTEQHDTWMGFERADVLGWLTRAGLQGAEVISLNETCSSKSTSGESAEVTVFAAVARKAARKTIK